MNWNKFFKPYREYIKTGRVESMLAYWVGKQDEILTGLFWSTTSPQVEGLYRAKDIHGNIEWVKVHQIVDNHFMVQEFDSDSVYRVEMYTHWLGPLPVPAPPTEGG